MSQSVYLSLFIKLLSLIAPSAPPTDVRVSVNSSTSITVQWGPVECIHQNGEITGYWLRYGEEGSSEVQMVSGDSSGGVATVSGLTRETVYTVQVAAVTSGGTGVYSDPLMIQTPNGEHLCVLFYALHLTLVIMHHRCLPQSQW